MSHIRVHPHLRDCVCDCNCDCGFSMGWIGITITIAKTGAQPILELSGKKCGGDPPMKYNMTQP